MVRWLGVISLALMLGWGRRLHVSSMFHGDDPHQFPLDPYLLSTSPSPILMNQNDEDLWDLEDESWWDGAEEIDLTLPRDSPSEYEIFQDILANDSCIWGLECEDFMSLRSPPNGIEDLPPPPLPPFLSGLKRIMLDSDPRWESFDQDYSQQEEAAEDADRPVSLLGEDECLLCRWAKGGNETLFMFSRLAEGDSVFAGSLAGLLIGVGLASAVIGATIMGTLLRCRKIKILPKGSDPCSYLMRKSWTKGLSRTGQTRPQPTRPPQQSQRNKDASSQGTTNHTGWAMKLWRRGSSQAPLNLCSSPENSYSEEPYVNADASSSLYAELNSLGSPQAENNGGSHNISNTYSEIPDPVKPLELNICPRATSSFQEGTYENAGYILSEVSDHNGSSTGSTSTPSSAYYSDVSTCEVYNNKKKRKKKKGNEKLTNECCKPNNRLMSSTLPSNVPVISGHIPFHSVHLNFANVQPRSFPYQEPLSLSLQVLPKEVYHNKKNMETGVPELLHKRGEILNNTRDLNSTLPNAKLVSNVRNYGELCLTNGNSVRTNCTAPCVHNVPNVQVGLSSLSNYYSDKNKNHCSDLCVSSEFCQVGSQRPLPPLPSRMLTGPKRKNVYPMSSSDHGIPAIPSEYV